MQQTIAIRKQTIASRIKTANLNMDFMIKSALEVVKIYAGSANADAKVIPGLYKDMLSSMLEVFEGESKK